MEHVKGIHGLYKRGKDLYCENCNNKNPRLMRMHAVKSKGRVINYYRCEECGKLITLINYPEVLNYGSCSNATVDGKGNGTSGNALAKT